MAAALAGTGALHAVWTTTPWPLRTPKDFADTVVGGGEGVPSVAACLTVAGALSTAAYVVGARSGVLPTAGPAWLRAAGAGAAAAALLARGAAGPVLFGRGMIARTDRFRRMDSRYYSPLCLALGAGAALVAAAGE
ncbi:DUF3995 domain-containing protein [Kitasatospora sp. NPDC004240]